MVFKKRTISLTLLRGEKRMAPSDWKNAKFPPLRLLWPQREGELQLDLQEVVNDENWGVRRQTIADLGHPKMKSKKQESPKGSPQKVPGFMYWIGEATQPQIFYHNGNRLVRWVPKLALWIGEGIFSLKSWMMTFWKAARNAIFLSIKNLGLKIQTIYLDVGRKLYSCHC